MVINSVSEQTQERLLEANDVAEILNISRALSYQLLKNGDIPTVRIRGALRIMPTDLEEYIQKCRNGSSIESF